MRTILVPLDGSPLAEQALPMAAALIHGGGGKLVLMRAAWIHLGPDADAELVRTHDEVSRWMREQLETVATPLRAEGLQVETRVYPDAPETAIPRAARQERAMLIVMSSHGRSGLGRWLFGSIAEEVLRRADVPVLVVPAGRPRSWDRQGPLRVLIPLDGSDLSEAAIDPTLGLVRTLDAELVLLRVVEEPSPPDAQVDEAYRYLEGLAERLRGVVGRVEVRVELGSPASAIAAVARETPPHLIAMATHRRGELARLVLGSVAMATLRAAELPMLMVRPAAVRAEVAEPELPPAAPHPPIDTTLDADELELVRCGLNRLLDDPAAGDDLAQRVDTLLGRLSRARSTAVARQAELSGR